VIALYPLRTPDIIASSSQRSLFRWWDRRRYESALPSVDALADESVTPHLSECVFYQVLRDRTELDFLATSHGSDVHPLFGHRLVGTLLSQHASPALVEGVLRSYRAVVEARRPVYTIRNARDERGVAVQIEILRLPLSAEGHNVDSILAHFYAGSAAGPFSRNQLIKTGSTEEYAVAAVIARRP
jgi:hypothetical protein